MATRDVISSGVEKAGKKNQIPSGCIGITRTFY
ncbi:MAG: hypothetical protein JWO09_1285 [Bacteroidetes bacterium]|nr:hypothetical protein [Bacteroidota bacterium]